MQWEIPTHFQLTPFPLRYDFLPKTNTSVMHWPCPRTTLTLYTYNQFWVTQLHTHTHTHSQLSCVIWRAYTLYSRGIYHIIPQSTFKIQAWVSPAIMDASRFCMYVTTLKDCILWTRLIKICSGLEHMCACIYGSLNETWQTICHAMFQLVYAHTYILLPLVALNMEISKCFLSTNS